MSTRPDRLRFCPSSIRPNIEELFTSEYLGSYNKKIITEIHPRVSRYHYDMDLIGRKYYNKPEGYPKGSDRIFENNLYKIRSLVRSPPCMHGSPMSKLDNKLPEIL